MKASTSQIQKQVIEMLRNYDDPGAFPFPENDFEKVHGWLIGKIDYLLQHDYEKLLTLLYRIDVDEEKAKAKLVAQSDAAPSVLLADMVMERMIEKAKSRLSNRPLGDANDEWS